MSETPLPNDPASRTPTGEIKDASLQTTVTEPPKATTPTQITEPANPLTEPKVEPAKDVDPNAPPTSLLNKDEPKAPVEPPKAPEKYEAFKLPEGAELSPETMTAAEGVFKELGLPQESAQKLVDFHVAQMKAAMAAPATEFAATTKQWGDRTMADPTLGPRIAEVKENIGRALDTLNNPQLKAEFKQIMDLTGAGSHPAFVKVFDKFASAIVESRRHVNGNGPSPFGQANPSAKPPTAASAMYPNLPTG